MNTLQLDAIATERVNVLEVEDDSCVMQGRKSTELRSFGDAQRYIAMGAFAWLAAQGRNLLLNAAALLS